MDELFEKLINDQLTPSELKELRKRFNASTDEELLKLIRCGEFDNSDANPVSQFMLDDIKCKIDDQLFGEEAPVKKNPLRRALKIVAAVLVPLLIVGGAGWYVVTSHHTPAGICKVATEGEETSSLTLPDGTIVKINGNSSISFPAGFEKHSREVSFSGEAYFEVTKDPKSPFTIITPAMTVTVKGTAFNLMCRSGAKYSELSLDNGVVTVTQSISGNTVDVSPGTKLILDNATGQMILKPINSPQQNSSWTSMEIYFENASPAYLVDRLEQAYNITLDGDVKKKINENFTGTLPANDLDEALKILNRIYGGR
ncbi:MAG: FecR domain-containing protein [Muribaculaceae bacterium]|nr:FecR domain-containing protein [Muribaculaceae bacterium]